MTPLAQATGFFIRAATENFPYLSFFLETQQELGGDGGDVIVFFQYFCRCVIHTLCRYVSCIIFRYSLPKKWIDDEKNDDVDSTSKSLNHFLGKNQKWPRWFETHSAGCIIDLVWGSMRSLFLAVNLYLAVSLGLVVSLFSLPAINFWDQTLVWYDGSLMGCSNSFLCYRRAEECDNFDPGAWSGVLHVSISILHMEVFLIINFVLLQLFDYLNNAEQWCSKLDFQNRFWNMSINMY